VPNTDTLTKAKSALQLVHARASPYVKRRHRVGGLMLANSTAVRHIFDRTLGLYDRLMERKVSWVHRAKSDH
jgi:Tubulin C-terminal domain